MSNTQPDWCCRICAEKYGKTTMGVSTWHLGTCDVCQDTREVTEPRDCGYLSMSWTEHLSKKEYCPCGDEVTTDYGICSSPQCK